MSGCQLSHGNRRIPYTFILPRRLTLALSLEMSCWPFESFTIHFGHSLRRLPCLRGLSEVPQFVQVHSPAQLQGELLRADSNIVVLMCKAQSCRPCKVRILQQDSYTKIMVFLMSALCYEYAHIV